MKGSIRFFVGLLLALCIVGAYDYAFEAGEAEPPLMQTVLMIVLSMSLMYSGARKINETLKKEEV